MTHEQGQQLLERIRRKQQFVKKTLTIPKYLDDLAKEKDINFSKLLSEALKIVLKVD
jgi:post-segregation antitoxin (ccd killing protein)